ncbi:MAG: recombinase RecA [Verrucomicrobiae bacterium]|nr:recombinase RecA [Verrucomicrobiae bacterium]
MAKAAKADRSEKSSAPEKSASKVKDNRDLDMALGAITKQFGEGSIMRLGDASARVPVEVIPSGAVGLDIALGVGGVPRGRIVEIFGPESSGKTTLMLHLVKNAQLNGGLAAFVDAEHALDPQYAKKIGVNLDDLLVSQPDSGEEALTIVETLTRSNALDIIIVDSVAALTPQAELEGQMGDATVGAQARLLSQAMRKLTGLISRAKTTLVFTNQIREKIGVMFGSPETTPGGRALKFYCSVRLDIRRIGQIKDPTGAVIGSRTRVKVVKNKVAPPFVEAEFDIMYNEGISKEGSILDEATNRNILEKKGSWLAYNGEMIGQGREAAKQFLRENPEICDKIASSIWEQVRAARSQDAFAGAAPAKRAEEPATAAAAAAV